jgi:hypothetical protein
MSPLQVKVHWIIAGGTSGVLLIILAFILPSLPAFSELQQVSGTIYSSTADTRVERSRPQSVFTVVLDGNPDTTYVVVAGPDPGYYRATQVVAAGDDVILWTYSIKGSSDLRIWQLSDRGELIVNYNEVYGVEKRYRSEFIYGVLTLLLAINGGTYLRIWLCSLEPPPPPKLMEMGG